jgi:hypothetical protein
VIGERAYQQRHAKEMAGDQGMKETANQVKLEPGQTERCPGRLQNPVRFNSRATSPAITQAAWSEP